MTRVITVKIPVTAGIFCSQFIMYFLRPCDTAVTMPEAGATPTSGGAVQGLLVHLWADGHG